MTDYSWYRGADLVFPTKPRKPIEPGLRSSPTVADYRDYADKLEAYEAAKAEYDLLVTEYWREKMLRKNSFMGRIRSFYVNDAQHEIIAKKAWEKSHDEGLEAVEATYDELVDLFKELCNAEAA